jgi:hypothetical protein
MISTAKYIIAASAVFFLILVQALPGYAGIKASYLFNLSNFEGTVPYMWPNIRIDNVNREVLVVASDGLKIFNNSGMEVYDFSHQATFTTNYDFAVDEEGQIYSLFAYYDETAKKPFYSLNRCNFKLEPLENVTLKDLPAEISNFTPHRIFLRNGLFYLGQLGDMLIVVTDKQGRYRKHYDIGVLSGMKEKELSDDAAMSDYFIDRDGSILFTAPVIGKVFRIAPDGSPEKFGKRGSLPGRFGIPAAIVADAEGNYLVSDKLRCVIIVFDKDFNFITEFGHRGPKPHNLVGPSGLTIDEQNRLYVSQLARRGVSVFQISNN